MWFITIFSQELRHNNDNDNTNVKRTDTQHVLHVATILSPSDIVAHLILVITIRGRYTILPII